MQGPGNGLSEQGCDIQLPDAFGQVVDIDAIGNQEVLEALAFLQGFQGVAAGAEEAMCGPGIYFGCSVFVYFIDRGGNGFSGVDNVIDLGMKRWSIRVRKENLRYSDGIKRTIIHFLP